MASIRRSKIFTPDAQTVRFLYLILKQLDLKTVNWQDVADNIGIKNGHAARMRWSRFKQQAEGTPTQPKPPKAKKNDGDKSKGKRDREDEGTADADRNEKRMKIGHGAPMSTGFPAYPPYPPNPFSMPAQIKPEPSVKQEPVLGFSQEFNSSICLPPTRFLWQPQPSPSTNPAPLPMNEGPQKAFAFPIQHDDDVDDIPIKQLNSNNQATVSLVDLHLSRPIKPEPGDRPEESGVTALALPTIEHAPTDCEQAPPLPHSLASQQPQIMQHLSPQPESGRLKGAGDMPRLASTSALCTEPTSIPPQTPAWIATSNGSSSSVHPSGYPGQHSYRPAYLHPLQALYGHYPPNPMNYHHRPMLASSGPTGFHANQAAPSSPHTFSQHTIPSPNAIPIVPFGPQPGNHFQATWSHSAPYLPPQLQVRDNQQVTVEHNQDENQTPTPAPPVQSSPKISIKGPTYFPPVSPTEITKAAQTEQSSSTPVKAAPVVADPQCLSHTKSPSPAMITASTTPPPTITHTSSTTKPNSDVSDDPSIPFTQPQPQSQPLALAHQQVQHQQSSQTPNMLAPQGSHKLFVNEPIAAPVPWWIQPQPQLHYHTQHLHQPPMNRSMHANPFNDAGNSVSIPSHQQHYQHQHATAGFGGDFNANGNPTAPTTTGMSSPFEFPFHFENRQRLLPEHEVAQGNGIDKDCDHELDLDLPNTIPMSTSTSTSMSTAMDTSMTLPMSGAMAVPTNLPMTLPMKPQFLIPHPDSEDL